MQKIRIHTDLGESDILLGEHLRNATAFLPDKKLAIVTDRQVAELYEHLFPEHSGIVTIGQGEAIKTLDTVSYIYDRFIEMELDRSSYVLGIGGGIVCDITGYAASTYLRGLPFAFVSTTLLSQVDASIGGKNGINYRGYKNMIGVFNQPEWVICDPEMLKSLPEQEFKAAFAEIIKHACIRDAEMFAYLESNWAEALNRNPEVLQRLVYDSLVIKSAVVRADEKEKGLRRILNFGHTVAHAIEKNQPEVIHGNAVSIGMAVAVQISVRFGTLTAHESERILKMLKAFNLPVRIDLNKNTLIESMKKDKKREQEAINFVLLEGLGKAIVKPIPITELKNMIYDLC